MQDDEPEVEEAARGWSSRIIVAAMVVTGLHLVAGALALNEPTRSVSGGTNLLLFLVGVVVFVVAFLIAANRSRVEDVWFGGVFFLSGGVAPGADRRVLLGAVACQTIVGFAVAIAAPFTAAAFAVLVPLTGLALVALYGAVHAHFPPKTSDR